MTGQSRTTTSRRKALCTWNCVCVVKMKLTSPSSSFSHSSSNSCSSCYLSTSPRLSSKIPCAASPRRWGQLTSPSPTQNMLARLVVMHAACSNRKNSRTQSRIGKSCRRTQNDDFLCCALQKPVFLQKNNCRIVKKQHGDARGKVEEILMRKM